MSLRPEWQGWLDHSRQGNFHFSICVHEGLLLYPYPLLVLGVGLVAVMVGSVHYLCDMLLWSDHMFGDDHTIPAVAILVLENLLIPIWEVPQCDMDCQSTSRWSGRMPDGCRTTASVWSVVFLCLWERMVAIEGRWVVATM